MKISDDDLKRLFRSYVADKIPNSVESCPSAEIILSLFFQASAKEEKTEIIDHISQCSRCLEVFDFCLEMSRGKNWLLTEIGTHINQAKKKRSIISNLSGRPVIRHRWKSAFIPLTAAILVTIAVVTIRYISTNAGRDDRGRSSGAVYLLTPRSEIPSKIPIIFKWSSGRETQYALLDIFDEALLPVWKSAQISGDSYELPPEAQLKIKKARTYFWMVTIYLSDGTEVESELKQFSISE
jgi:hypothetical protein